MAERAFLDDDGLLWNVYDGDINGKSVGAVVERTEAIMTKLQAENRPILIIVDLSRIHSTDSGARRVGFHALTTWPYKKMALFGGYHYLSRIINIMLMASRKQNARLFANEATAKAWLKESK